MTTSTPPPQDLLYSVRMRASHQGRHVSGAEDLVAPENAAATAARFAERALATASFDDLRLRIEPLREPPTAVSLLPLFTVEVPAREAVKTTLELLERAGVSRQAAEMAYLTLSEGAAGGGTNMRGAMLVDAISGVRLEADHGRGIRASRYGVTEALRDALHAALEKAGYGHHRTTEAWVLSAKMAAAPGAVAELCFSDDPNYTTGYVAIAGLAYVRLPHLKAVGDPHGGRALFLSPDSDPQAVATWLEKTPCLITDLSTINPPAPLNTIVGALRR